MKIGPLDTKPRSANAPARPPRPQGERAAARAAGGAAEPSATVALSPPAAALPAHGRPTPASTRPRSSASPRRSATASFQVNAEAIADKLIANAAGTARPQAALNRARPHDDHAATEMLALQHAAELEAPLAARRAATRRARRGAARPATPPPSKRAAAELHRALAAAVEQFRPCRARAAACRRRCASAWRIAGGQVAAQREALARATAALDRAIDVLLPNVGGSSGYGAGGASRPQRPDGLPAGLTAGSAVCRLRQAAACRSTRMSATTPHFELPSAPSAAPLRVGAGVLCPSYQVNLSNT
ncbi:MAG: hypothetical protein MZW92_71985 [Comamonadaceae bacterium]|nr:hypothetical protein [Comamonadaceae bacterium]